MAIELQQASIESCQGMAREEETCAACPTSKDSSLLSWTSPPNQECSVFTLLVAALLVGLLVGGVMIAALMDSSGIECLDHLGNTGSPGRRAGDGPCMANMTADELDQWARGRLGEMGDLEFQKMLKGLGVFKEVGEMYKLDVLGQLGKEVNWPDVYQVREVRLGRKVARSPQSEREQGMTQNMEYVTVMTVASKIKVLQFEKMKDRLTGVASDKDAEDLAEAVRQLFVGSLVFTPKVVQSLAGKAWSADVNLWIQGVTKECGTQWDGDLYIKGSPEHKELNTWELEVVVGRSDHSLQSALEALGVDVTWSARYEAASVRFGAAKRVITNPAPGQAKYVMEDGFDIKFIEYDRKLKAMMTARGNSESEALAEAVRKLFGDNNRPVITPDFVRTLARRAWAAGVNLWIRGVRKQNGKQWDGNLYLSGKPEHKVIGASELEVVLRSAP